MKRTYIKITALICTLIMVAIALGGILFTIIQVSKANSEFNKEISSKKNMLDMSDVSIENDAELESTLVLFNGMKFLTDKNISDVGHYGRYVYSDGFSSNNLDTSGTIRFAFTIENDGVSEISGDEGPEVIIESESIEDIPGSNPMNIYFTVTDSNGWAVTTSYADDEMVIEEDSNQVELNQEAMELFEQIIDEYSTSDNVSVVENGWKTSYALKIETDTLFIPFGSDSVKVYMYDMYVFHPLETVFKNYAYAYILFVVLLILLWVLTGIAMRRMYINRMNFEARTKNLTRSFAHELKTPLAVTQAYVENWELVSEKERSEVAAKINEEIDHMNKMVNTLLNLSKMDSGDVTLDLQEVELFELAQAVGKHMKAIADERNINIEFRKDDEDSEYIVMADLDMINMAISNFLSNAVKYGKEKVEVSLQSSGKNIIFRITNDGETISPKDQKKIWDLFYKKDKSGTDRMGSNGVGLAVNKSILELHKAKFGVNSGSGETTFWFEMKKAKE